MKKRTFIKTLSLGLGMGTVAGFPASAARLAPPKKLLPKRLQPGDRVGLISPSAATADRMEFTYAREAMEALGLSVKEGKYLSSRRGHLAGSDAERAEDLNEMFGDKRIKAVVCIRGGSGAARILPLIDYELIRKNPKPILGYSDITALHNAIHAQTGLVTFHGPNGSGSWNPFNANQFRSVFFGKENRLTYRNEVEETEDLVVKKNRIRTIYPGKASGDLVGGNLTVLTALAGSPYLPDFKNKLLFLEDIGEEPYRIDRMMSTLMLMGVLKEIKGFVFGQCTDCDPSGGYGNLTIDQILDDYLLPLRIPAYRGAMIGHVPKQFLLPFGAKVTLDADAGTLETDEAIFQ
ncbi:muramoyltetrapeptide carboxypeptidase [Cyclobacterium xiamenense]|uniref:Muramoyltetrapeptide carboxypeptidase n=1 Tax=Cyclobacterium xiamenense TaxID=1297121 RepID=A0A1H6Y873_9BACT|nr:LD-carboxypeptidase [Cyclobacterium xiamenense]SEJ36094.1 muramoyltetrapeptide carboxypeptidase [Cyclobacterium xiamenense]